MKEIWDLYNVDGIKVNETVYKGDIIPRGYYHIVVDVYVVINGTILVTKRSNSKLWWPDKWENIQGSVISGESARQGAIRELSEEVGITVKEENLVHVYDFIHENNPTIFVGFVACIGKEGITVKVNSKEISEYRFLSYHEYKQFVKTSSFVEWSRIRYMENMNKIDYVITNYDYTI